MKKTLLIAVLAFGLIANAQDFKVKYGAKAGVNIANITGAEESFDPIISFHAGGFAEFLISDKFSIQPELLYSVQGAKNKKANDYFNETILNLNYLNLPIMAKYYIAEGFSLEVGSEIGLKLGAKVKVKSNSIDAGKNFKDVAFGLNFGAGYKLDNGLNFGARYNLGLTNISKYEDDDSNNNNISPKNSVIQFSVGYFFN